MRDLHAIYERLLEASIRTGDLRELAAAVEAEGLNGEEASRLLHALLHTISEQLLTADVRHLFPVSALALVLASRRDAQEGDLFAAAMLAGQVQSHGGRLEHAEACFRMALDNVPVVEESGLLRAKVWHELGNIRLSREVLTGPDSAEEWFRRALRIREAQDAGSLRLAAIYHGMGNCRHRQDILVGSDSAEEWHLKALAIREEKAPGSLDLASTYQALGNIRFRQGPLTGQDSAEAWYLKALEIRKEKCAGSRHLASTLYALGNVRSMEGQLTGTDSAEERYLEALAIEEAQLPGTLVVASTYDALARVAHGRKEIPEAVSRSRQAWDIVRAMASSDLAHGHELLAGYRAIYINLIGFLVESSDLPHLLRTLEETKADALHATLSDRHRSQLAPELTSRLAEAERRFAELDQAFLQAEDAAPEDLVAARRAAADEVQRLRLEVVAATTTGGLPPVDEHLVRERFGPDTVVLHYMMQMGILLAIVDGELRLYRLAFPEGEEASKAFALALAVLNVDDEFALGMHVGQEQWLAAGALAGSVLIPEDLHEPIARAKTLVVCPDGDLWRVPFGALALPFDDALDFLGRRVVVCYSPSIGSLLASKQNAAKSNRGDGAYVAGIDDFGGTSGPRRDASATATDEEAPSMRSAFRADDTGFTNLQMAELESKGVACHYGATPRLGHEAVAHDLDAMVAALVLHYASHGIYLRNDPLGSGIAMHPIAENKPTVLDGRTLSSRRLAALVAFFSCCVLARGEARQGAGLMGLSFAMQMAGVPTTFAALYPISDAETPALTVAFHEKLSRGVPAGEAWRQVCAETTANPCHWAAFVLYGDPDVTLH